MVGSFDAVYWTADVEGYESALHAALSPVPNGLDVWVSGSLSPLARSELTNRGWVVHDKAEETLAEPPRASR